MDQNQRRHFFRPIGSSLASHQIWYVGGLSDLGRVSRVCHLLITYFRPSALSFGKNTVQDFSSISMSASVCTKPLLAEQGRVKAGTAFKCFDLNGVRASQGVQAPYHRKTHCLFGRPSSCQVVAEATRLHAFPPCKSHVRRSWHFTQR